MFLYMYNIFYFLAIFECFLRVDDLTPLISITTEYTITNIVPWSYINSPPS